MGITGILTKANEAKTETEKAEEEELRRLTALEASTNLESHPYTDKNGDSATIPAGFAVSQVEGENIIDNGLVVIDSNGNEFVWVPVENTNEFITYSGYKEGNLQDISDYHEPAQVEYQYLREQDEYDKMRECVSYYKGFFVGRYEAGTTADSGNGIRGELIIKQNVNVYNNIIWGNSMMDPTGGAVQLAKDLYARERAVTSTLIYGVQWDAIMAWIEPRYKNQNPQDKLYEEGSFIANSIGKGYYNHSRPALTGSSKDYSVKNIYDLAGNVYEWSMESYSTNRRVFRGR